MSRTCLLFLARDCAVDNLTDTPRTGAGASACCGAPVVLALSYLSGFWGQKARRSTTTKAIERFLIDLAAVGYK